MIGAPYGYAGLGYGGMGAYGYGGLGYGGFGAGAGWGGYGLLGFDQQQQQPGMENLKASDALILKVCHGKPSCIKIMNAQNKMEMMNMASKITDAEALKFCKGSPSCVKKMMGANKHLGMMNLGMTNPHDQCAGMKNKVQCQIMIRNNQNRLDLMQMTSKITDAEALKICKGSPSCVKKMMNANKLIHLDEEDYSSVY